MNVHRDTHMQRHTQLYMYTYIDTHMHINTDTDTHACTHRNTQTHRDINAHTEAYIYAQTHNAHTQIAQTDRQTAQMECSSVLKRLFFPAVGVVISQFNPRLLSSSLHIPPAQWLLWRGEDVCLHPQHMSYDPNWGSKTHMENSADFPLHLSRNVTKPII